ncbi:MAG TPA: queuosine precursor transporter [Thermoanaerobaculia bacterium]|nr:queuosine precursor transporter [Thermoanaerobaculia bacterium]
MQEVLPRFIEWLQSFPPEVIWPLIMLWCFGSLVALHRLFGQAGVYVYIITAILAANIQVLKAVKFSVYPEPVALGTVVFSSTYLATDILTECYGPQAARRGVMMGFVCYLFFTGVMIFTLGYRPLSPAEAGTEMAWALPYHDHIAALFLPSPGFFIAGMVAYLVSQFNDVLIFQRVKRATHGRFLWLRTNVSTAASALIDNTVFSVLAWMVLNPKPVPWKTVVVVYIFGTYWLRLVLSVLDTPFMYLARRWRPAH